MLKSTLYLSLFAAVSATVSATVQCGDFEKGNDGFLAKFYGYNLREKRGWSSQFFTEKYVEGGLKTTIPNVVNSNFRFSAEDRKVVFGKIYGYETTISNYTLELTGYFSPTITGTHIFTIKSDNGVSLKISQGGECCNNPQDVNYDLQEMNVRDKENGGGKIDFIMKKEEFHLEKGVHYFVKVVTFNWQGNGGLDVSFVSPDSKCVSNFGSVIYQPLYDIKPCSKDNTSVLKRARKQQKKKPKTIRRIVSTQKKPNVTSRTLNKSSRKLQTRTEKTSTKSQKTKISSNIIPVSSMTSSSKMVSKSSVEDSSDKESLLSSRIVTTKKSVSSSLSTSNLHETTFSSSAIVSSEENIELFSSVVLSDVINSVVNSSQQTTQLSSSMISKEPTLSSLETVNTTEPMELSSSEIHTDETTVFSNSVTKFDPVYSVSNSVFETSVTPKISETFNASSSEPESLPFVESSSIDLITSKIQLSDSVSSFSPEIESMTSFKTESSMETLGNHLSSPTTNDIDEKSPKILVPEVKGKVSSSEICLPEEKECFSNASVLETTLVTSVPDIESFSSKKVENKVVNPKVFEENAMDNTVTKSAKEGNIYDDEPQTTTTIYSFITNTLETTSYTKKKPGNSTNHSGSQLPSVESYTNGCEKLKSVLEVKSLLSAFGTLVSILAFF